MATKLKSSLWSDFSERVVAMCGFPQDAEIRLYRKSDNRRVRSDLSIKRKHVTPKTFGSIAGNDNVADLLSFVKALLSTDIDARGFEIRLYGPDGERVFGNTHVSTIRALNDPQPDNEGKTFRAWLDLLDTTGLGDIPIRQAGLLLNEIQKLAGPAFAMRLIQ